MVIESFLLSGVRGNSILSELNHFFYSFFAFGLTSIVTLHSKEYIVVNSPQNEYVYNFTLQLDGLVAQLMENGSVVLYDELTKEDEYYSNFQNSSHP